MSKAVSTYPYKLPELNSYAAEILTKLLSGAHITNAEMMEYMDCPHAGSVMSKIRVKFNWQPYLKQKSQTAVSGVGKATYEYVYWFDPAEIMIIKANDPRIQKFIDHHTKS
ncbi:hypothetical protein [Acinetobacter seifertii]|uniref:hypothetical protein n=1 Tax=Acinetobacter seifertii TaxID=1530123 RepID=UPI000C1F26F6|nr:hypothetical protein [Acinetobacter seifertii]PJF05278.1 hypothetical protein CVD06_02895 [Acinetobacter seifertii]PJG71923.1 hypothetical protein CVD08_01415 [Acinetobacter seifertii]